MNIFMAGSVSNEINKAYMETVEPVMQYIDKNKDTVICCSDTRGIIGKMYQKVKGTDRILLTVAKTYLQYTKNITDRIEIITDTINERTDISIQKADILLFFPGGIGTIYELFSCLETKKGGEHNKPILIVNYFGYYNAILEQLQKGYQEKFIEEQCKQMYQIANTSEEVIHYLESYRK